MRSPTSNENRIARVEPRERGLRAGKPGEKQARLQDSRIECWAEADAALAELGQLERRLEGIEQRRSAEVAQAEQRATEERQRLEAERARLAGALEGFCRRRGPELRRLNGHTRRSRRLLFGRVGYRASQAVVVRSETSALRALAGWGAGQQFLRTRTELDREALRRFLTGRQSKEIPGRSLEGRLRRAGIELERRDIWFYEVDGEAVERWS